MWLTCSIVFRPMTKQKHHDKGDTVGVAAHSVLSRKQTAREERFRDKTPFKVLIPVT